MLALFLLLGWKDALAGRNTHDGAGLTPRDFTSFTQAASEASLSRLLGGLHFRSSIERGTDQGTCVARTILIDVQFEE